MLTQEQVSEAVQQMKSHCRMLMEQYEAGVGEYASVSARGVLYTLGYAEEDADQVIQYLADRGFNYCIDPMIVNPSGVRPSADACYWGADQLESRISSYW